MNHDQSNKFQYIYFIASTAPLEKVVDLTSLPGSEGDKYIFERLLFDEKWVQQRIGEFFKGNFTNKEKPGLVEGFLKEKNNL